MKKLTRLVFAVFLGLCAAAPHSFAKKKVAKKTAVNCVEGFDLGVLVVKCDGDRFFAKLAEADVEKIVSLAKQIPDVKFHTVADNILLFEPTGQFSPQSFAAQIQEALNESAPKYQFLVKPGPVRAK